jgi:hypothetical protein
MTTPSDSQSPQQYVRPPAATLVGISGGGNRVPLLVTLEYEFNLQSQTIISIIVIFNMEDFS